VVTITKVPIFASEQEDESEWASKLLSHHLTHTYIEPDGEGVPFANPSLALTFSSFSSLYSLNDKTFESSLFRLGGALFDDLDLRLADTVEDAVRNRVKILRRRDELSRWLQNVVSPTVEAELRDGVSSDAAAEVFTLLTGNEVDNAVEAAISSGNVKLAALVAQAGGDDDFRAGILSQLKLWKEQRIDAHISEPTRKTYALLAGVIDVLECSGSGPGGARIESCPDVYISADLDWKRAFGLHLWFGQPIDSSVADAFDSYEAAWTERRYSVAPPLPWYSENATSSELKKLWNLPPIAEDHPDALYSMIHLFSSSSSSLSTILTPLSFSASPIDYRLCWHLYIIMSRCLGVRDFSDRGDPGPQLDSEETVENNVEGHSPSADLLTNSYALQLEQLGMIQEAVFVLLHIEGSVG
jgi:nuclear pore complex protein Nup98-Nup96